MRHEDFKIGEHFYKSYLHIDEFAWSKWRCTDIGARTIAAIRVDESVTVKYRGGVEVERRTYSESEAEAAGLFRGPPYSCREYIFDEYSLPNCYKEPTYGL